MRRHLEHARLQIGTVPRTTNVTKLALSIASMDAEGTRQCTYYHPGVGTSRWDHIRGGAFGTGLSANVLDALQFAVTEKSPKLVRVTSGAIVEYPVSGCPA